MDNRTCQIAPQEEPSDANQAPISLREVLQKESAVSGWPLFAFTFAFVVLHVLHVCCDNEDSWFWITWMDLI